MDGALPATAEGTMHLGGDSSAIDTEVHVTANNMSTKGMRTDSLGV